MFSPGMLNVPFPWLKWKLVERVPKTSIGLASFWTVPASDKTSTLGLSVLLLLILSEKDTLQGSHTFSTKKCVATTAGKINTKSTESMKAV